MTSLKTAFSWWIAFGIATSAFAQNPDSLFIRENYQKYEYYIPMRDGVRLFTHVYVPKDASEKNKYPIMMMRTCYSVAPYGLDRYPTRLGPSPVMMREKYIFVYQDVRGRYMSEGQWTNMTPHIPNKKGKTEVDEASDTYDTIEWLLKNIKFNNGRVGLWGISYPGFYAAASALCNHPALKAVSPQAPIGDFFFDDFHHNGAFTLSYIHTFPVFGVQKKENTPESWFTHQNLKPSTRDIYQWLLDLGPLKNITEKIYPDNFFWREIVEHPNYDEFWQKRDIVRHMKNLKPAMMVVGGWFDAEDLYGPLSIYKANEKGSPKAYNTIVMGPFGHGRWARDLPGPTTHTNVYFGDNIAQFYQQEIEAKFFRHFLKESGNGKTGLPEAYMFDTGAKKWQQFDAWPPKKSRALVFYLRENGKLSKEEPTATESYSEYISDPAKPVPYTENYVQMSRFSIFDYMSEDQRFAARRPDVLVFQTEELTEDLTLAGDIQVKLRVSTTGSDADFFVKLIDVYPGDEPDHPHMSDKRMILGGYQQMVRSEIMRARFRNSFEKPEPMQPGQITEVNFRLQDVLHTFKKGHRIMIQVQSTAFPLFDRNPQKYVENIYKANAEDFIKATHRVYHQKGAASAIEVRILPE
ncbi:MAG: CocE/NonD family hydrolase [Cytophagales bacterium]|nr:CocE/NonD family hydrolase [Bernardetiaceae bacterium]MDW8210071.1 CocE/NonD family hydrolase [Cytophagales bacterium]